MIKDQAPCRRILGNIVVTLRIKPCIPLEDPGVLIKGPGVLLKDPGVLLKDPGSVKRTPGPFKGTRGPFKGPRGPQEKCVEKDEEAENGQSRPRDLRKPSKV